MDAGITTIAGNFKLSTHCQLARYFPENKNNIKENFIVNARRMCHYLKTGVRITDDKVCEWARQNPTSKTSDLLQGKAIRRRVIRHENGMVVEKQGLLQRISAALRFAFEFIKSPGVVGSIVPSSVSLAKEIVKEIPKDLHAAPRIILEAGPGVGSFTDKIIKRMNPHDELHLVEFDENFAELLRQKYQHIKNVKVFHVSILDHVPKDTSGNDIQYDYIVSGVPLTIFTPEMVTNVLNKFNEIAKPNAKLSYFEYAVVPKIKSIFSTSIIRRQMNDVVDVKREFFVKNGTHTAIVLKNFPLARVLHHKLNKTAE